MNLPPGVNLIDELRSDDRVQTLRAQPPGKSEPVIIKIITPDGGHGTADQLTSRLDQWRAISHRSVLRPTHVRGGHERLVLMMPDIPTGSLEDRLRMGAVSSLDFGELCQQACTVLEAMHAAGMPHGNLKPSNLLIDLEGNLLVSDPLLLSPAARLYEEPTRDDRVYLAPEVLAGGVPSPAADQYSLALILLTLLTAQPADQAARVLASMAMNGGQANGSRGNGEPYLPKRAVHALRKALTVNPENRWPSLDDFNRAFQDAFGYQSKPVSKPRPKPQIKEVEEPRRRKTSPWLLAAPAMALFLCGMLIVPAYSLGIFDRGLVVIAGQQPSQPTQATQVAVSDVERSAAQATPTAQAMALLMEEPPDKGGEEQDLTDWSNLIAHGYGGPEPTKEQVSVSLAAPAPATATPSTSKSDPVTSQDPVSPPPTPTSTPVPTQDTSGGGSVNPNACKSDSNHRNYCTPTPAP